MPQQPREHPREQPPALPIDVQHAGRSSDSISDSVPVQKQAVLFLCTHNSARSQMAQGLLTWLAPERYIAFSAGTHPTHVHPLAVKAMAELGINILPQGVHPLSAYQGRSFDLVVTVCDQAAEECPVFSGARQQRHWGFADPSSTQGTEDQRWHAFRHTRDLMTVRLRQWLATQPPVPALTAPGGGTGGK